MGRREEVEVIVTDEMAARFPSPIGLVHPLYSTWAMVHHMEWAARKVLEPFLEDHEQGVGSYIKVRHLAPCPIGEKVRVVAEAVEVEPHRLVCQVEAWWGETLLGVGKQEQRIVDREGFKRFYRPPRPGRTG